MKEWSLASWPRTHDQPIVAAMLSMQKYSLKRDWSQEEENFIAAEFLPGAGVHSSSSWRA